MTNHTARLLTGLPHRHTQTNLRDVTIVTVFDKNSNVLATVVATSDGEDVVIDRDGIHRPVPPWGFDAHRNPVEEVVLAYIANNI